MSTATGNPSSSPDGEIEVAVQRPVLPTLLPLVLSIVVGALIAITVASGSDKLREGGHWWAVAAVVPLCCVAVAAYAWLSAAVPLGFGPLTLAGIGLVGAACVPETDHLPTLIATCVSLAIIEWTIRCRLDPPWAVLAAGAILMWGLLYGAVGRPSALVGGLFAWWPLLLGGVAAWITSGSRWHTIAAIGLGALAAAVVARTGGVGESGMEAVRWAAAAAAASTLGALVSLAVPGGPADARLRSRFRSTRSDAGSHRST